MAYPRDAESGSSQYCEWPGPFQWNLKIFPCSRSIAPISYRKGYGGGGCYANYQGYQDLKLEVKIAQL